MSNIDREQTTEECVHDLTDSRRRGFGSSISLHSHDDLRYELSREIPKYRSLPISKSVPAPLHQVFNIESAGMCMIASGEGRNTFSTGEDNIVPTSVDFSKRYRENAERIIKGMKSIEPKVETELLTQGRARLQHSKKKKLPFIILKGSGCGCKFTAKTIFQEEVNKNEQAVGYFLTDPKHFSEIDLNQKSVILILDACGGTQFDRHRIDKWHEIVRNCMPSSPGPVASNHITIIMTVQNFDEVNNHPLLTEYSTHVLDATLKIVRPSHETKKQMVTAIMKHHFNETEPSQNIASAESNCSFLNEEIIDKICPLLGSIGYIRVLNQFLRNNTSDGIQFFEKPIPELVDRFRKYFEENKEKFVTMLAVYSHDGSKTFRRMLSDYRLNEREPKFTLNKHEKYRRNILRKFVEESKMLPYLYDTVERRANEMEGLFLEESNGIYMFASKNVYNSFLVVLCEHYSEAIAFCEEEFFFNYIKKGAEDKNCEFVLVGRTNNTRLEAFMERLIRELLNGNVSKCMNHPALKPELFRSHFKRKRDLTCKVLNMQDKDITGPFSCLVYGMDCQSTLPSGKIISITDVIIEDGFWEKTRKKRKRYHWTKIQEDKAMIYAASLNRVDTFKSLVHMGAAITHELFLEVVQMALFERGKIIGEIITRAQFSQNQWLIAGHYLLQRYVSYRDPASLYHLQSLLSNVKLNSADRRTEPFLHRVVRAGDIETVKVLISDVAVIERLDIDLSWKCETALDIAAESGFAEIASFLLQCGAKRRIRTSPSCSAESVRRWLAQFLNSGVPIGRAEFAITIL